LHKKKERLQIKKHIGLTIFLVMILFITPAFAATPAVEPAEAYAAAQKKLEDGDLFGAADAFKALKKHEDSPTYLAYTNARILTMQQDFEGAIDAYAKLEGFLDSDANAKALADMMLVPLSTGAFEALPAADLRYGLMDAKGNQVTPLQWQFVIGLTTSQDYFFQPRTPHYQIGIAAEPYHVTAYLVYDGILPEEGEWGCPEPKEEDFGFGLIDAAGNLLVEATQGKLLWCGYGMAAFSTDDGRVALFNLASGAAPHASIGTWDEVLDINDPDVYVVRSGEQWFYIGRDGSTLCGPFEKMLPLSDGLGAVCLDGKWGYVDGNGQMVIEPKYEAARSFADGKAAIKQDGAFRFITAEETEVFDGRFEDAGVFSDGVVKVCVDGKYGFADSLGEWLVEPKYDHAEDFNLRLHVAAVERDGKWGLLSRAGKEITKLQYDEVVSYTIERTIVMKQGEYWGQVTDKGKAIGKQMDYLGAYGKHVQISRVVGRNIVLSKPDGKSVKSLTITTGPRHNYTVILYENMGIVGYGIRYIGKDEYAFRYFDAKGKGIKPVALED